MINTHNTINNYHISTQFTRWTHNGKYSNMVLLNYIVISNNEQQNTSWLFQ